MQNLWVYSLQTDRNLQLSRYQFSQSRAALSNNVRMTLYDYSVESGQPGCYLSVICRWNSFRVEEAAGIVELDLTYWRELGQSIIDLRRYRAARRRLGQRVLP